jgi:uncharacterized membrane protein
MKAKVILLAMLAAILMLAKVRMGAGQRTPQ